MVRDSDYGCNAYQYKPAEYPGNTGGALYRCASTTTSWPISHCYLQRMDRTV